MVSRYKYRTRRRPRRLFGQSQKVVIKLVQHFESKRRKGLLRPPKYKPPRVYRGRPITVKQTDSLSQLGLLPGSVDLLAAQRIGDIALLKQEALDRKMAVVANEAKAAAARAEAEAKAAETDAAATLPAEWLLGKALPSKAFLLARAGIPPDSQRQHTSRQLVQIIARQNGVTNRDEFNRLITELRGQARGFQPGQANLDESFLTPMRVVVARPPPGDDEEEVKTPEGTPQAGDGAQPLSGAQPPPVPRERTGVVQPLFSGQVDLMLNHLRKDGYLGCFARDEIVNIRHAVNKFDRIGAVVNLDPVSQPGSHWCALYIDFTNEKSCEWFNSLADAPEDDILAQLKQVVDARRDNKYLLKFKVSTVRVQSEVSSTCGLYAAKFLLDRFAGVPFAEASGYRCQPEGVIRKNEVKMRGLARKFGYI